MLLLLRPSDVYQIESDLSFHLLSFAKFQLFVATTIRSYTTTKTFCAVGKNGLTKNMQTMFWPFMMCLLLRFQVFLEKEYSQENIEFWAKCEEYKKLTDVGQVQTFPTVLSCAFCFCVVFVLFSNVVNVNFHLRSHKTRKRDSQVQKMRRRKNVFFNWLTWHFAPLLFNVKIGNS